MSRDILLPVVLTTIVGCGPLVGVASLTFEDAGAAFDASEHDDAIDSTTESDGSRDQVSEGPRSDATVAPDAVLADEPIDDATADAEVGADDAELDAPDGAGKEGGGDATVDAADASPGRDAGSAADAGSEPGDDGSDADDDSG